MADFMLWIVITIGIVHKKAFLLLLAKQLFDLKIGNQYSMNITLRTSRMNLSLPVLCMNKQHYVLVMALYFSIYGLRECNNW